MNITPASAAAFAVICVALWLGWLWHEYRSAIPDPAESEPLLDRIAREHLASFFAEWQQQVESEVAE